MNKRMHENLVGMQFGKLKVLEFSYMGRQGHSYWLCQCECGNCKIVRGSHLKSGNVKSCGCWNPRITHGMSGTRIYNIWVKMLQRCENNSDHAYFEYGERGITVCKDWHQFETFFNWAIFNGYSSKLTIDRINNNKGYYPNNCRWATPKQQANNNRHNHLVEFDGEQLTISQLADRLNIEQTLLRKQLLSVGWDANKLNKKRAV